MTAMDDECFSNCVCKPHKKDKRFNDKKKNVVSIAKKDHVLKYCRKRIRSQNSTIHKSQGQNKNHIHNRDDAGIDPKDLDTR